MDDHTRVQEALGRHLRVCGGFRVYSALNSREALDKIGAHVDAVLLDIHLGENDIGGVRCLELMRSCGFQRPICALSADSSLSTLVACIDAGADGYLVKNGEDINEPVRRLVDGRFVLPSDGMNLGDSARLYLFSRGLSQPEVLFCAQWVADGFPDNKEIAFGSGLSERTVSRRFVRIRRLLKVRNQHSLAAYLFVLCRLGRKRYGSI